MGNNNKNLSATEEPELKFEGQVFDSSSPNGTLLIAAQDMSSTLTGALHAITSTPPTPPLRSAPSSRTPLPPTPPPPTTHPLYNESNGDNNSLPSPPTEMMDGQISQSYMEKTRPRPIPPAEVIEDLEKKIEIQYKKYPKLESTSSKPATPLPPLPPERSNSQGKLRSVKSSPQHTPTMQRKIMIKAVRTPSSSPVPFETAKLQEAKDCKNISISKQYEDSKEGQFSSVSGIFQAIPVKITETSLDEAETTESTSSALQNKQSLNPGNRTSFLNSMIKVDESSKKNREEHSSNKSENELETERETILKARLEKKEKEIAEILQRKKDQEYIKRPEFEENRIKEESEKLKLAAEEKRKREAEDKRIQKEKEEKNRSEQECSIRKPCKINVQNNKYHGSIKEPKMCEDLRDSDIKIEEKE